MTARGDGRRPRAEPALRRAGVARRRQGEAPRSRHPRPRDLHAPGGPRSRAARRERRPGDRRGAGASQRARSARASTVSSRSARRRAGRSGVVRPEGRLEGERPRHDLRLRQRVDVLDPPAARRIGRRRHEVRLKDHGTPSTRSSSPRTAIGRSDAERRRARDLHSSPTAPVAGCASSLRSARGLQARRAAAVADTLASKRARVIDPRCRAGRLRRRATRRGGCDDQACVICTAGGAAPRTGARCSRASRACR